MEPSLCGRQILPSPSLFNAGHAGYLEPGTDHMWQWCFTPRNASRQTPRNFTQRFLYSKKTERKFYQSSLFYFRAFIQEDMLPSSCYVAQNISTIFNRLWHPIISSYFLVVSASLDQTWLHKKSFLRISISHGLTSSESQYNHYLKTINMSFPKTFVCLWFELKKYIVLKNEPNIKPRKKLLLY